MIPELIEQTQAVTITEVMPDVKAADVHGQVNQLLTWGPVSWTITFGFAIVLVGLFLDKVVWPAFHGPSVPPGSQPSGGGRGSHYLED